jgi:hypothetical protein
MEIFLNSQIGAMKSSLLYFNEASEALQLIAKGADYVQRTSDVYSQVELTRGLMLFGQDKVGHLFDETNWTCTHLVLKGWLFSSTSTFTSYCT